MSCAESSTRGLRLLLWLLSCLLLTAIAALTGAGCREKDNPVGPGPNDTTNTPWRLVLGVDPVVYLDTTIGQVNMDTLTVRLYDTGGVLRSGVRVYSVSYGDPNKVTPVVVTTTDTTHRWWGTSGEALKYWGVGADNGQEGVQESIFSYALANDDDPNDGIPPDTLAKTTVTFAIRAPSSPQ